MTDPTRRLVLGSALGAGGLLLPWQGCGALAVPDLGAAAGLTVVRAPLPISAEGLEMRLLRVALRDTRYLETERERASAWNAAMDQYYDNGLALLKRPVRSWSHCVELAELAWHAHAKALGPHPDCYYTDRLEGIDGRCTGSHVTWGDGGIFVRAIPSLIEAVLTMGGGQRVDPRVRV
jgi:hypothetical protein